MSGGCAQIAGISGSVFQYFDADGSNNEFSICGKRYAGYNFKSKYLSTNHPDCKGGDTKCSGADEESNYCVPSTPGTCPTTNLCKGTSSDCTGYTSVS